MPEQGTPHGVSATELRTFLIADIRGYTIYTREHGDEAAAALASRFAELVSEVVTARDGYLLEVRGDEALCVFVSARRALRAAVDLQARFIDAELPRGVGIGLDAGEAIPVGDGFRGTALNLAARLCARASAGETLASEAVIHLAAKVDGIAYVDARTLRLKGFEDSVRAVTVVRADQARGRRLVSRVGVRPMGRRAYAVASAALMVVVLLAAILSGGVLIRAGPTPTGAATAGSSGSVGSGALPDSTLDPLGGVALPVLAFFDAESGRLKATTPLNSPSNISFFDRGSYWVVSDNPKAVSRIDPVSRKVVQSISVPVMEASGYAVGDAAIWITDLAGPHVVRVDQRTGVVATFPFGTDQSDRAPAVDVAVGGGSVWLSRPDTSEIVRLDPQTGTVQARIAAVQAYGVAFGEGALWYTDGGGRLGRIDPATNAEGFEPLLLTPTGFLGNIAFGGGDAWVTESSSGHVWRVDRSGRQSSFALDPGVGELEPTADTMWVTNADTGKLTGIDLITGDTGRVIDSGHGILAIAAGADEIMIAVGPTVGEAIAGLEGSVLTLAVPGSPWTDPSPDPALNGNPLVRQVLYLTCVALLDYPDKPAPDGWKLEPEAAAAMPTISPDGRTYTFTIRPGYVFSPPSNEPLTAETFRATIERALSPVLDDDAPGPSLFSDIVGVKAYRASKVDHVAGLVASGDELTITLEAPAPDFLQRLASPSLCPVPIGTPVLRSGLDPDPPISGAGPYYPFAAGRHSVVTSRLVILKKNPNYRGPRPQPFDNIAMRTRSASATSISEVLGGRLDAAMLDGSEAISSGGGAVAAEWGPGSANAASGDQRWFGAARHEMYSLALDPSRPAFHDPDVRRAVSLALDRIAAGDIWVITPSAQLLPPSVPGSVDATAGPPPDLEAARSLMKGRTLKVTMMGFPIAWDCGQCRDFENAVTGQLKALGITVVVRHPDDDPGEAFAAGSGVDLVPMYSATDIPDPVALIAGLHDDAWLGEANLRELDRLRDLSGQERIDAAAAFVHRIVDEQVLVVPVGYGLNPFFMSERIGCGFIQPAIAAVDLLSLCRTEGTHSPAPSPGPSTGP